MTNRVVSAFSNIHGNLQGLWKNSGPVYAFNR